MPGTTYYVHVSTTSMSPDSIKERLFIRSSLTQHRDTYPFIDPYRFRNSLTGQVVLITNAHRGIGRASALDIASAGAVVVCVARSVEQLQPVLLELRARGYPHSYGFPMDFSDPASPAKLVNDVEQTIGPIDVLLNINNGPTLSSFIHTGDFSDWWSEIERNLRVPIALIHAVLPPMVLRGKGTIITTVFRTGAIQLPFCSSSSTAHSALLRFHHGLDEEIRPKGIYSYAVHPGLIASYLDDPEIELHDPKHYFLEPRLQALKKSFFEEDLPQLWCSSGLASGTFLTLAADPRAKALSGLYVDAERDLGELIQEMEKGDASRVIREKMNVLKVDEL